ncbi:MAG: hypothetical protein K8T90_07500 [Planctomycetes bacterium]|nr:hypothetical protein [Planctomycetota bacterium]
MPPPELEAAVQRWRRDPAHFARSVLGVTTLWRRQVEILEALRDHRRVAVPSCHESGKTFVASVAAVHHLVSYQPSKVITTAPTQRQVKDLLWSEIRARHTGMVRTLGGDPGLGAPNLTQWAIPDEPDWFATGFATSPDKASENATRLHGYHSPHLLVILDEAGGIAREVWSAIDGLLTSGDARVLAIGNPSAGTEFERVCRSPDWRVLRIAATDCPNLQPGAQPLPWGVTRAWVEEMRRRWGASSPVFQTKVLGLFPESSVDTLLSIADVEAAIARRPSNEDRGAVSIGCDVARFGSDETVIYVVRGGAVLAVECFGGQDTMRTAGAVLRLAREHGVEVYDAERIAIDDTGIGGAVVDRLREQGWDVQAINFGASPRQSSNETRFFNRRTELWWDLREWVRHDAALGDLSPDTQDALRADLTAPKYEQRSDGRIALEPKDRIRQRVGRSPDHGDALALAIAARVRARFFGPDDDTTPPSRDDDDEDDADVAEAQRRCGPFAGYTFERFRRMIGV